MTTADDASRSNSDTRGAAGRASLQGSASVPRTLRMPIDPTREVDSRGVVIGPWSDRSKRINAALAATSR